MASRLLLCTDLDRTLLPNGTQPESPGGRALFARLARRPEVTLAYVTGRHRALVEKAIAIYQLPLPDFVIADVGSTVYQVSAGHWSHWGDWEREISSDWSGRSAADLKTLFSDLQPLRLQEVSKQNVHKLSYYVSLHSDSEALQSAMQSRLQAAGIRASLIWSVDEPAGVGLLDVLPETATKRHAIEFLMERNGFDLESTVFAGDSGNDLPVLISDIQAVLVANGGEEVRRAALAGAARAGLGHRLYLAQGGFRGMNGNYSAGIVEGVVHYLPEAESWLENGDE